MRLPILLAAACVLSTPALACDMCKDKNHDHGPGHEHAHEQKIDGKVILERGTNKVETTTTEMSVPAQAAPIAALALAPTAHWGYGGGGKPSSWGSLDKANAACSAGLAQSPVNITQFLKSDQPDITFDYKDIPLSVKNAGHGIEITVPAGSKATLGGKVYELISIDFHTPSEHYMDGAPYPMEAHFLHKGEKGEVAILSTLVKLGKANDTVGKIWGQIPVEIGAENAASEGSVISAYDLLPGKPEYFTYEGSLTAPPCTEGVTWFVMQQPIEISQEQLAAIQNLFPMNARPLQPLNGRMINGD